MLSVLNRVNDEIEMNSFNAVVFYIGTDIENKVMFYKQIYDLVKKCVRVKLVDMSDGNLDLETILQNLVDIFRIEETEKLAKRIREDYQLFKTQKNTKHFEKCLF